MGNNNNKKKFISPWKKKNGLPSEVALEKKIGQVRK